MSRKRSASGTRSAFDNFHSASTETAFSRGLRSWQTWLAVLYWLGFLLFLPGIVAGLTRGIIIFPCLLLGTLALRIWCRRRGIAILSKAPELAKTGTTRFYVKTLLSYIWRSFLFFAILAGLIGFASDSPSAAGAAMGVSLGIWFVCSLFTLDVPFWTRRAFAGLEQPQSTPLKIRPRAPATGVK